MSLMLVCTMNLYIFLAVVAVLRWKASRDLSRRVEDLLLRFSRLQSLQTSGQTKKYRVRDTAAVLLGDVVLTTVPYISCVRNCWRMCWT